MAVVVFADSFCTCASVDARAAQQELPAAYNIIGQVLGDMLAAPENGEKAFSLVSLPT